MRKDWIASTSYIVQVERRFVAMPYRHEKIQELLHHEVARTLQRDFAFAGVLITVTGTRVSSDGQHAAVSISVFPENDREKVLGILEGAIFHIQQNINRQLRMRPVPKIRFVPDHALEHLGRIDQILKAVHNDESSHAKPRSKPRRIRKAT